MVVAGEDEVGVATDTPIAVELITQPMEVASFVVKLAFSDLDPLVLCDRQSGDPLRFVRGAWLTLLAASLSLSMLRSTDFGGS